MELFPPLLLLHIFSSSLLSLSSTPPHDCPSHCGPTPIPYPFGVGPAACSLPGFTLSCVDGQPFLSDFLILNISNGELRVDSTPFVASDCASGARAVSRIALPDPGLFAVSAAANRLIAAGCDTVAVVSGADGKSSGGCVSLCSGNAEGGSSWGFCEAALPEGQRRLGLGVGNMFGYRNVSGSDNCSYAFVVEKGEGGKSEKWEEWWEVGRKGRRVAMRLEWELGGGMCLMCRENGHCVESGKGSGYLCYCMEGFDGNPYLNGSNGCQGKTFINYY